MVGRRRCQRRFLSLHTRARRTCGHLPEAGERTLGRLARGSGRRWIDRRHSDGLLRPPGGRSFGTRTRQRHFGRGAEAAQWRRSRLGPDDRPLIGVGIDQRRFLGLGWLTGWFVLGTVRPVVTQQRGPGLQPDAHGDILVSCLFQGVPDRGADGPELAQGLHHFRPHRRLGVVAQGLDQLGHDLRKGNGIVMAQLLGRRHALVLIAGFFQEAEQLRNALGRVGLGGLPVEDAGQSGVGEQAGKQES